VRNDLEPLIPVGEEDNSELQDFQRRFWWTLPLTLIVTTLAMFGHKFGWFTMQTQTWVELALSPRGAMDGLALLFEAGSQSSTAVRTCGR
jgi:hypothetical protein